MTGSDSTSTGQSADINKRYTPRISINTITDGDHATILWDFPIHTDRTIKANRPDIVVKDHKEKKCFLIDMTVPTDRDIAPKAFEKLFKY